MRPHRIIAVRVGLLSVMQVLVLGLALGACSSEAWERAQHEHVDWAKQLRNFEKAISEKPDRRFFYLADAAKSAFEVGDSDRARAYAQDLLEMTPQYKGNWNFGNAVHDGHLVLGRVALASGEIAIAKAELLAAGATPGSPQLNSFGPNMSLARDLLKHGERETVLQYFRECDRFWEMGRGRLREWSIEVRLHIRPAFGFNLVI